MKSYSCRQCGNRKECVVSDLDEKSEPVRCPFSKINDPEYVKTNLNLVSDYEIEEIKKQAVRDYKNEQLGLDELSKAGMIQPNEPWPCPEFMDFELAWLNAEIGDKVSCAIKEGKTTDTLQMIKDGPKFRRRKMDYRYAVSKLWQIIPAEPVVFSAEKILKNVINQSKAGCMQGSYLFQMQLITAAEKNGELKEQKRVQPLIDAMKNGGDNLHVWYEKVWKAFNSIKEEPTP